MDFLSKLASLAMDIQQIPAPTGQEAQRAAFMMGRLSAEGLEVIQDVVGNVYARVPGSDPKARPVVVSAHLDTVFPADTPLTLRREGDRLFGPGIGDNSVAVAALLGLWWLLQAHHVQPQGDLWLVANVGEEGLGNLKGMKAVVARFGVQPKAYIVLEGLGLGWVYHRGLGVRRYALMVQTTGGHAWADAGSPSAVHEMAALIQRLTSLPLPRHPRTTLNVGMCQGGVSINTIAPEAVAEVDLRSEDPATLAKLSQAVETETQRLQRKGVSTSWKIIGERPAGGIPKGHPLVQAALQALQRQKVSASTAVASTDANVPLSLGFPAICMGLTHGGGAHTTDEFIYLTPLATGMAALEDLVQRAYRLP